MPYKFVDGLTVADVAFDATGSTLSEMFASAGEAVTAVMVKDIKTVKQKIKKEITLQNEKIDMLLFNFLEELVFLKDAELLLFSRFDVKIKEENGYTLNAVVHGDKLDAKRQEHLVDVKAVTLHKFEAKKTETGWYCRVILDI